jgi:hypothetical protein
MGMGLFAKRMIQNLAEEQREKFKNEVLMANVGLFTRMTKEHQDFIYTHVTKKGLRMTSTIMTTRLVEFAADFEKRSRTNFVIISQKYVDIMQAAIREKLGLLQLLNLDTYGPDYQRRLALVDAQPAFSVVNMGLY